MSVFAESVVEQAALAWPARTRPLRGAHLAPLDIPLEDE